MKYLLLLPLIALTMSCEEILEQNELAAEETASQLPEPIGSDPQLEPTTDLSEGLIKVTAPIIRRSSGGGGSGGGGSVAVDPAPTVEEQIEALQIRLDAAEAALTDQAGGILAQALDMAYYLDALFDLDRYVGAVAAEMRYIIDGMSEQEIEDAMPILPIETDNVLDLQATIIRVNAMTASKFDTPNKVDILDAFENNMHYQIDLVSTLTVDQLLKGDYDNDDIMNFEDPCPKNPDTDIASRFDC